MNDAPPDGGVEHGAPLRDPLTIADAARRAGVHPNTIRRLIKQERVAARLVRGRYGDTWLVESEDIDRAVGGHLGQSGQPAQAAHPNQPGPSGPSGQSGQEAWSGLIDSPDALPASTDLSLDRARALERYTHGLLQPLVDLLREREAALEGRDALIRTQAERIGRLERELELIRAFPNPWGFGNRSGSGSGGQASEAIAPPGGSEDLRGEAGGPLRPAGEAGNPARGSRGPSEPASEGLWTLARGSGGAQRPPAAAAQEAPLAIDAQDTDDLPTHVTSLAGQVGRLRAELQLIATALRPDEPFDETEPEGEASVLGPPRSDAGSETAAVPAALAPAGEPVQDDEAPPPSTAITVEELAGLFPASSRGRLTLEPLEDGSGPQSREEPPTSESPATPAAKEISPAAPRPDEPTAPDPFAEAEAAVAELRRALSPEHAGQTPAGGAAENGAAHHAAPPAASTPDTPERAAAPKSRRWWWPW